MLSRIFILVGVGLLAALIGGSPAWAQEDATPEDVEAAFANLTRAEVEAMGYHVEDECITAASVGAPPFLGAMGFHAIQESIVDTTLDPLEPEVILFDADDNVVAVEYLTPPQDPPLMVLGQQLTYVEPVDHDGLHLWFLDNPNGQFADFNPNASCPQVVSPPSTGTAGISRGSSGTPLSLALAAALLGGALLSAGVVVRRLGTR